MRTYAAIRSYRTKPALRNEVIQHVIESFVPTLEGIPGLLAYYIFDAEDGTIASISVFDSAAGVETSNERAEEWIKDYLIKIVRNNEGVPNITLEVEDILQGHLRQVVPWGEPRADLHEYLSVKRVSEALGVNQDWVRRRINDGEIPSTEIGGSTLIRSSALVAYLRNRLYETLGDE